MNREWKLVVHNNLYLSERQWRNDPTYSVVEANPDFGKNNGMYSGEYFGVVDNIHSLRDATLIASAPSLRHELYELSNAAAELATARNSVGASDSDIAKAELRLRNRVDVSAALLNRINNDEEPQQ